MFQWRTQEILCQFNPDLVKAPGFNYMGIKPVSFYRYGMPAPHRTLQPQKYGGS